MATKKEELEKCQQAFADYISLSKYLFGDDAPLDVNEIPIDNPYYDAARAIAEDMDLDWATMTHEDSTRVMLNLLGEYFYAIKPDSQYKPVLSITFKKEA